jgi:hypothetical protein
MSFGPRSLTLLLKCKQSKACYCLRVVTYYVCSEILYEDSSFSQRELAALVASKVSGYIRSGL